MEQKYKANKGLEELGKTLLNLANLIMVVFLFNTYLQKDNINFFFVMFAMYGIFSIYYIGYILINKAQK